MSEELSRRTEYLIGLAWHDVTCPEGEDCRDRDLHAISSSVVQTGIAVAFARRLAVLGSKLMQELDPRTVTVDGVTYRVGDPDPTEAIRGACQLMSDGRWASLRDAGPEHRCSTRDDGYFCTWGWKHPGTPHVAGVDGVIVHLWQDPPMVKQEHVLSVVISDEMMKRAHPDMMSKLMDDIVRQNNQIPKPRRFADGDD